MPVAAGEREFPAPCHWRARISRPLPLETTNFLPFAAGESDFSAICTFRCLLLENMISLPFAAGRHEFLALWRWRVRASSTLPLENTGFLHFGAGGMISIAFAPGDHEFRCLPLGSTIFLPFVAGEHELLALRSWGAGSPCPLAAGELPYPSFPIPLENNGFLLNAAGEHDCPSLYR